jgi:hypothetical protein
LIGSFCDFCWSGRAGAEVGQYNHHRKRKQLKQEMPSYYSDFTIADVKNNGFSNPVRVKEKTGLDIKVPEPGFSIVDVLQCVGMLTWS